MVLPWRWRQPGPLINPFVFAMLAMSLAQARSNNLMENLVLPWRWRKPGPLTNPLVFAMLTMSLAPARTNNLILLFMLIDRFAGVDRGNPDNLIAKPDLRTLRDT